MKIKHKTEQANTEHLTYIFALLFAKIFALPMGCKRCKQMDGKSRATRNRHSPDPKHQAPGDELRARLGERGMCLSRNLLRFGELMLS